MALATVIIKETNGAAPGTVYPVSAAVTLTLSNMGIADTAETSLSSGYAIPAGSNSYEKFQRLEVYANAAGDTIQNIKVWEVGTIPATDTHYCGQCQLAGYTTPTKSNSIIATTQPFPLTVGDAIALKIGGTVNGLISTTGFSDYLVHQIRVGATTTTGPAAPLTMYWQYDEYSA